MGTRRLRREGGAVAAAVVAVAPLAQCVPRELVEQIEVDPKRGPAAVVVGAPELAKGDVGGKAILVGLRAAQDDGCAKVLVKPAEPARAAGKRVHGARGACGAAEVARLIDQREDVQQLVLV